MFFSSGMAGIDAVFRLLRPRRHVVLSEAVYGGVFRLSRNSLCTSGWNSAFVDTSVPDFVRNALRPNTKMLYIETPANPTLSCTASARFPSWRTNATSLWWSTNTFLSPYLQGPIELGAHIVVHSHDEVFEWPQRFHCGAVVLTPSRGCGKDLFHSALRGHGPLSHGLLSRFTRHQDTGVRMLQHNANGIAVARHLDAHPKIKKVFYPGLPSHPQHEVARRQQKGPGAMLSFDVGSLEAARRLLNHVKLCSLAESLGGVETLISLRR